MCEGTGVSGDPHPIDAEGNCGICEGYGCTACDFRGLFMHPETETPAQDEPEQALSFYERRFSAELYCRPVSSITVVPTRR